MDEQHVHCIIQYVNKGISCKDILLYHMLHGVRIVVILIGLLDYLKRER